jgi:hypothetical protein
MGLAHQVAEDERNALPVNTVNLDAAPKEQPAAVSMPPVSEMRPLPLPVPASAALQELASSTTRSTAAKGARSGPSAQLKEALRGTKEETTKATVPYSTVQADSRLEDLGKKQRGLDNERMGALEKALHAKDLTDSEKIGMALITLLPTLVGGIAGGALAGKAGAAAGVAGGLGGASQGIQSIVADKEKEKEQALAQASQAAARGDKLDQEILQRQEQLDRNKQFSQKMSQDLELAKMREQGDTARAAAANQAHLKAANIQAYSHLKGLEMSNNADLAKAEMKIKQLENGGEMKDFQGKASSHAIDMLMAKPVLDNIKDPAFLNSFQSWGNLQSALADPQQQVAARAILNYVNSALYQDTGAAISEKEWNTAFSRYIGRFTSSPQDLEYAKKIRDAKIEGTLGIAGPAGRRIAIDTVANIMRQQQPPVANSSDNDPWSKGRPVK